MASPFPQEQERPVTRWTLEAIATTVRATLPTDLLSRSSIWRILPDVDRKPPKSADGRNRHDADCDAKAPTRWQLDGKALAAYEPGRRGLCCEAKTGRQGLERPAPPQPAQPGRCARREPEDIRHGTRVLIHALAVATGQIAWTLGATRTATDFVAHRNHTSHHGPRMPYDDWGMDNWHTHWSLDVCRLGARWGKGPCAPAKRKKGVQRRAFLRDPSPRHVFHGTPQHGAWLNQAAVFFGTVQRRFLARGRLRSVKDFERR